MFLKSLLCYYPLFVCGLIYVPEIVVLLLSFIYMYTVVDSLTYVECVWIEINTRNKKLLIGTFYRPPNSSNATFAAIEDSIGLASYTIAYDILITGDFNINMADNRSSRKINDLCQEYGLSQLVSDFTHFTETSQSTIDLLLTNNSNAVLTSGVGEPFFRPKHSLSLSCFLCSKFQQTKSKYFQKVHLVV